MSDNIRRGAVARVKSLRWMADPINDDRGTVEGPAQGAASKRRRASAQPARAGHDAGNPGADRREGSIDGSGTAGAKRIAARGGASLGGADGGGRGLSSRYGAGAVKVARAGAGGCLAATAGRDVGRRGGILLISCKARKQRAA